MRRQNTPLFPEPGESGHSKGMEAYIKVKNTVKVKIKSTSSQNQNHGQSQNQDCGQSRNQIEG
jgi:hypothetical protein